MCLQNTPADSKLALANIFRRLEQIFECQTVILAVGGILQDTEHECERNLRHFNSSCAGYGHAQQMSVLTFSYISGICFPASRL